MEKLSACELFRQQAFIGGRWRAADSEETLPVCDPATGEVLGTVPMMGKAETQRAIESAATAFPGWSRTPAKERAALLRRWFDLVIENREQLAFMMTREQGKPLAEARGEVLYAASFVEWFAEEAKRVYGEILPPTGADKRQFVLRQPVGVCAAITPWNFPAAMITRKLAPALAAGCTVVLKPAEQTPFTALALAALAEAAGFPAGVLNVVTGDAAAIGGELTANPTVRKLSFTGSTEVGRLLMEECAPTIKKVSFELGGNAPFVVFDDADVEAAVEGAVAAKFRNAGQTCICANRLLVQAGIYERFTALLVEAVRRLKVGPGTGEGVTIGPLIDRDAVEKVESHIADGAGKGAAILLGGQRHSLGGNFFEPTVLADATPDMRVAREETFGPLAPVFRFTSEEEALRMANNTEYGLAAYFYTRDLKRIFRFGEALEYGMIGINTGAISSEVIPFGGIKQSGIGREGSRHGIDEYLEFKLLWLDDVG